jgi:hypothetical protein
MRRPAEDLKPYTRINRRGRIASLSALELENRWLKVRVLPEVGAKIYDLVWKPSGQKSCGITPGLPLSPPPSKANSTITGAADGMTPSPPATNACFKGSVIRAWASCAL